MAVGLGYKHALSMASQTAWGTAITATNSTDHLRAKPGGGMEFDKGRTRLEGTQGTLPGMQKSVFTNASGSGSYTFDSVYEGFEVFWRSMPFSYAFAAESGTTPNTHTMNFGAIDQILDGSGDEAKPFTLFVKDTSIANKTRVFRDCFVRTWNFSASSRVCESSFDIYTTNETLGENDETHSPASSPVVQMKHLSVSSLQDSAPLIREFSLSVPGFPIDEDRFLNNGTLASPVINENFSVTGQFVIEYEDLAGAYDEFTKTVANDDVVTTTDALIVTFDSAIDVDNASGVTEDYQWKFTLDEIEWTSGVRVNHEGPGPVLVTLPFELNPDSGNSRFFQLEVQNDHATAA